MSKVITDQCQSTALSPGQMRTSIPFKCSQPSHTPSSFSLQNPLFLLQTLWGFCPCSCSSRTSISEIAGTVSKYKENKTVPGVFLHGSSSFIQITRVPQFCLHSWGNWVLQSKGRVKMHWANHITEFCTQIHGQLQRSVEQEHQQPEFTTIRRDNKDF